MAPRRCGCSKTGGDTFDVVVLDLRLPDVNDLSLVAKVRSLSPESRLIVMTAFGTPEVAAEGDGPWRLEDSSQALRARTDLGACC